MHNIDLFNDFWPFNAKLRVASGEEYWVGLKNRQPCLELSRIFNL